MRHGKKFNHLSRTSSHRKALLANLASSLILHKKIETTVAKAKELKKYIEPLITKSKDDSTHSRRLVFSYLKNKSAVSELYREVAQKIANRPGGYTRILRLGNRMGDNADICIIELVDYNENMLKTTKADVKAKKPRSRRAPKKKTTETPKKEVKAEVEETTESTETGVNETKPKAARTRKPKAKAENKEKNINIKK
ncbi:MAG: 50S ribosomal protein L17 [Bacteroidia bacterium]|nr:50S ribosomal protein L17 [Bacteroidia bacterium]